MAATDHSIPSAQRCVGCGAELPPGASQSLCPKCLLKLAMETQPAAGPGGTVVLPRAASVSRGLPQAGEQFGHYAIVRLLGAGGMGAVYEAEDRENGRRIALKVLSHALDSPDARERFFREGRLAASINHPNSVYVFGTEEIGGTPVIAMELVAGGTLQERVRAKGPLPAGEAVDCVLQIVEGLEAAQRIGILHRDVKPSNCYTGEDGTVKIGDFGLSISTAVRTEPALTATGAFLGTPAFCSPEQLRGEELNARSDMYSVGATLYYLLTGRTPFEAANVVQLLATVLEQQPPSPRKLHPNIPQGLAKAVLRCLEKESGERFKTYAELSRALAPYASAAPTPATLGLRFLAGAVDMLGLCALAVVVNVSFFGTPMAFLEQAMQLSPKALACMAGWVVMATGYFALFEGLWGAAAGKALCRLRVVGAERNPPGVGKAWVRALVYLLPPFAPYWAVFGANPQAYMGASQLTQTLLGLSCYVIMGLLFVTARRGNGFAALQDILTRTRVVSLAAMRSRRAPIEGELPPPSVESAVTIGPYHVLQALEENAGGKWFLAYDLKLLRKVWLHVVPEGTPPVPSRWRDLARAGRLRWLTGKRSPEENWDAFEALSGRALLDVINSTKEAGSAATREAGGAQSWSEVRYWLHDLAVEIGAAEKDRTLPELALDRVWITAEGRVKLLDFPAPGPHGKSEIRNPKSETKANAELQTAQQFLDEVAVVALTGDAATRAADAAVPMALHARAFLKHLPGMANAEAVAGALKPLLSRAAGVSRLRRTALVAGCISFPVLACVGGVFAVSFLKELNRRQPGLMELSSLLQMRTSGRFWGGKNANIPADRQIAIYVAQHYRGLITNQTSWSSPFTFALVKGEARKFAEQSVAEHSEPTQAEIAEADAAVDKYVPRQPYSIEKIPAAMPPMVMAVSLLVYVGFPAVAAALLFRGGLVLLIAGVTYVRKDGRRASRLRLLWRGIVAWSPVLPIFFVSILALVRNWTWEPWLALVVLGLLAAVSVALPGRGLQDRLAGTWPVVR